ncbi:MAG: DegT/DnrJ/EryC1/StrS family aminotransferase, partial [Candidatus Hodarchaeota archaeon]
MNQEDDDKVIPIAKPSLDDEELERIKEVLASGMLVESRNNRELEKEFAAYTGAKQAISASNGTAALHLAME